MGQGLLGEFQRHADLYKAGRLKHAFDFGGSSGECKAIFITIAITMICRFVAERIRSPLEQPSLGIVLCRVSSTAWPLLVSS